MKRSLASLSNWRLQHVLILSSALTTAITIAIGSLITYGVINNYLASAQDARLGRDMDLADAFYNNKLHDMSATAQRVASSRVVEHNIGPASQQDASATEAIKTVVDNEISNLPSGAQRFIVVTYAEGNGISGCLTSIGQLDPVTCQTDWAWRLSMALLRCTADRSMCRARSARVPPTPSRCASACLLIRNPRGLA
jgi:hypothetical protein